MDGVPREESAPQRDKLGLADVGSLYDNRVYQPQRKIGACQTRPKILRLLRSGV